MDQARTPEETVAHELSAWRDRTRVTAQQLADRIAELGGKLSRQAISKIENGDRGVSLDELLLIARALRVPPALLLFPIGRADEVGVLPGVGVYPGAALRWFTGEARFPTPPEPIEGVDPDKVSVSLRDPEEGWEQGAAPALLFREHQQLVREWWAIPPRLRELPFGTPEEKQATRDAQWARVMADLRRVHEEMRRHGLTPPPIPKELTENSERPDQGS